MQIDKIFSTQFVDPDTKTPIIDLTGVTITIIEIASDGTTADVPINNQPCINGGNGFYRYYFSAMQDKVYEYFINPNDDRVHIASGWVDKRLNNLDGAITDIRAGGGGGSVNIQGIQTTIRNARDDIKDEMKRIISEIPKVPLENIETKLNEIVSQNDIAKEQIIDTIKSTGDDVSSDVIRKSKELKDDNVKTRNLIREKTKKLNENVSKLADRQDLIDKTIENEADEIEAQIEQILNEEADMIEEEIYNREADEIENEINSNQSNDGNSESNS